MSFHACIWWLAVLLGQMYVTGCFKKGANMVQGQQDGPFRYNSLFKKRYAVQSVHRGRAYSHS